MNFQKYKQYLPFIALVVFFIILASYSASIYLELATDEIDENYSIEVSLPISDWSHYNGLSKRYEPAKIEDKN